MHVYIASTYIQYIRHQQSPFSNKIGQFCTAVKVFSLSYTNGLTPAIKYLAISPYTYFQFFIWGNVYINVNLFWTNVTCCIICKNFMATLGVVNVLCSQGDHKYVSRYPMVTDGLLYT